MQCDRPGLPARRVLRYAVTQVNPSAPASGSGALAAITFKRLTSDVTTLKVISHDCLTARRDDPFDGAGRQGRLSTVRYAVPAAGLALSERGADRSGHLRPQQGGVQGFSARFSAGLPYVRGRLQADDSCLPPTIRSHRMNHTLDHPRRPRLVPGSGRSPGRDLVARARPVVR